MLFVLIFLFMFQLAIFASCTSGRGCTWQYYVAKVVAPVLAPFSIILPAGAIGSIFDMIFNLPMILNYVWWWILVSLIVFAVKKITKKAT
jgi:hypothetical protein